jgi:hypothetical protein
MPGLFPGKLSEKRSSCSTVSNRRVGKLGCTIRSLLRLGHPDHAASVIELRMLAADVAGLSPLEASSERNETTNWLMWFVGAVIEAQRRR